MWDVENPVWRKPSATSLLLHRKRGSMMQVCLCLVQVLPEDGILRHQDGVLVPWPGFPLSQHTTSKTVIKRWIFTVSSNGTCPCLTAPTLRFLRRITLMESVEITILTFFFLMFFSLNSYCQREEKNQMQFAGEKSKNSPRDDHDTTWCESH